MYMLLNTSFIFYVTHTFIFLECYKQSKYYYATIIDIIRENIEKYIKINKKENHARL